MPPSPTVPAGRIAPEDEAPAGVGGWLLVFCLLLAGWEPTSLALAASSLVDQTVFRGGLFAAILAARLLLVALGIAAALGIWHQRAFGVALAKATLVLSAAMAAFLVLTPYFPSNLAPDLKAPVLAGTLAYYLGWYVYLRRSRRVRALREWS
ncbi:MAG TPA: hypothetical protein VNE16_15255 [Vicinamibacterales bacterium]|nr:hypothetical protein [Vicinamibacterales bacterium]